MLTILWRTWFLQPLSNTLCEISPVHLNLGCFRSVRLKLGWSLTTFRGGWTVHLYWRFFLQSNDAKPGFSRAELGAGHSIIKTVCTPLIPTPFLVQLSRSLPLSSVEEQTGMILYLAEPGRMRRNRTLVVTKWFRGGLVFKAHRLLYRSTLGSKIQKKKKKIHLTISLLRGSEGIQKKNNLIRTSIHHEYDFL